MIFLNVLKLLHESPAVKETALAADDVHAFRRKRENWKKTVRLALASNPELMEIAVFLGGRGKELAEEREFAAHWPASRAVKNEDGRVHFSDPRNLTEGSVSYDTPSLLALAGEIQTWGAMVGMLAVTVIFEVTPEAWPGVRNGQKPEWMFDLLRHYQKTPRTRRSPKIAKPQPPRRSSAG